MNRHSSAIIICIIAISFGIFKLLPIYYFAKGTNCFEKQNYVCAYKNFHNTLNFDKTNKDYRYNYVLAMGKLSPTIRIQKEVFGIASGTERDSAQLAAQNIINQWKINILKGIGNNYIEQAPTDKGIIRWDINKFPLKVGITGLNETKVPAYYKIEILKAFSQWQASTGILKFSFTDDAKNAQILVKISPTPKNICTETECKYVVGYTTPEIKGNLLQKMDIILYTKDPNGNYFSDKELYNTILHEIGHALGIMGHSYSSDDLMYMSTDNQHSFYAPYRSSFQYISSKDINTIKLLYKLLPTISNTQINELNTKGLIYAPIILGTSEQISRRKLREAQNYVKKAPDLAGGYIDLGIAYAELKKYKEAIKSMEKAFNLSKTDNEKYMAAFNLAAIYLEKGDLNSSLKFAQIAKQISNTEEIKELIINIKLQKSK